MWRQQGAPPWGSNSWVPALREQDLWGDLQYSSDDDETFAPERDEDAGGSLDGCSAELLGRA